MASLLSSWQRKQMHGAVIANTHSHTIKCRDLPVFLDKHFNYTCLIIDAL